MVSAVSHFSQIKHELSDTSPTPSSRRSSAESSGSLKGSRSVHNDPDHFDSLRLAVDDTDPHIGPMSPALSDAESNYSIHTAGSELADPDFGSVGMAAVSRSTHSHLHLDNSDSNSVVSDLPNPLMEKTPYSRSSSRSPFS